jgi:hypothetical protein
MDLSSSFDWDGDPSSRQARKESEKNSFARVEIPKISFAHTTHKFGLNPTGGAGGQLVL